MSFLSASMQANIISLLEVQEAIAEVENCSFHNVLGLTRQCYLCRKYNAEKIELRVCEPDKDLNPDVKTKSSLKQQYVDNLLKSIDLSYPCKTVFITAIGIRRSSPHLRQVITPTVKLYCDFLIRKEGDPSNAFDSNRSHLRYQLCKNFEHEFSLELFS